MVFYIVWMVLTVLVVFLINAVIGVKTGEFQVWYAFVGSLGNFAICFALDALIAFIIHKIPPKYFQADLKIFKVYKWERRFYEKIGIKKWKDRVPDTGELCNFKKDKLKSTELDYLHLFLVESCYAEAIHIAMALIGILDIFIWPIKYCLNFTIPMAITNFLMNLPPILIQRYNRPKLMKLYNFKVRSQKNSIE